MITLLEDCCSVKVISRDVETDLQISNCWTSSSKTRAVEIKL